MMKKPRMVAPKQKYPTMSGTDWVKELAQRAVVGRSAATFSAKRTRNLQRICRHSQNSPVGAPAGYKFKSAGEDALM
jgi:hypothetical protein